MSKASAWLDGRLAELMASEPYIGGESVESIAERYNLDLGRCLKLNANENLVIPRETIEDLSREALQEVDQRVYPQKETDSLRESLGGYLGVAPNTIVLGSGADQLIDHLVNAFSDQESGVLTTTPSYSFYKVRAELYCNLSVQVPLQRDFGLDVDSILSSSTNCRLCFLCSPNNPTGNQFTSASIIKIVDEFPGVVVVDEAYAEFGDYNLVKEASERDNLVVLRTFSKAFGLAGLRIGYMIGSEKLSRTFNERVQYPFCVPNFSAVLCKKMLDKIGLVSDAVSIVKEERQRVSNTLSALDGLTIFDSDANFILFNTDKEMKVVFEGLLTEGLLVRRIGEIQSLRNCLRVTVGTPAMNDRFITALTQIVGA
ncbi:MAG: histidinol-phosphate transaminase [Thaumarchaeota archaeon]|nr:histidinol-phosphate transaminase [Nitrososphaerota archaeon]